MRRTHIALLGGLVAAVGATAAIAASDVKTGPSSSQSPYVVPVDMPAGVSTRSILTVGDAPSGSSYQMVGIPDGLGAYDNGNGTFTLLMNHELGGAVGGTRAHGATGAFVSKWTIAKDTLRVLSGSDLIQDVYTAKSDGTYDADAPVQLNRFCSADLPARTAFWNPSSGKGYDGRVFMNGEESGDEGRAFANFVTGPQAGKSYELPYLGRFSWENAVAHPNAGDRTIVVGLDDSTPGQVYVYAGDKTSGASDSAVKRAGLANGALFGIRVLDDTAGSPGLPLEFGKTDWQTGKAYAFEAVDVSAARKSAGGAWSGAALQSGSVAATVTEFERPEDGAWDPRNARDFYFVTTSNITPTSNRSGRTRLWRMRFDDPTRPQDGGTLTPLIQGAAETTVTASTVGPKMFDNIAVSASGQIMIQEDPGNQAYVAKVWLYDIASGKLKLVAEHDRARFVSGGAGYLGTQDEESSGAIDVSDILGQGWYLFDVQAHYAKPSPLVEGGQLLAFHIPPGKLGQLFG